MRVRAIRADSVRPVVLTYVCLVMLVAATAYFGAASTAGATTITTWSGVQPKGNVGTNTPISVSGSGAYDGSALVPASAKLYVDGALISRGKYSLSVLSTRVYFYYNPQPKLTDGVHTFRVEVTDAAARLSTYQWSATIVEPPAATWIAPAAGSTVRTGRPAIVMSLSDNTPTTAFTVTGQIRTGSGGGPVVGTFGGAGLSAGQVPFMPPSELPPGTYYLTASVTDGAGNTRALQGTLARSFTTQAAPAMSVLTSCDACHPTLRTAHPTPSATDCTVCHPGNDGDHMEGTEYCEDCHWDGWHTNGMGAVVAVTSACTDCHTFDRPDVPSHTAESVDPGHAGSCNGCHVTSLVTKHASTPAGSLYASQCDVCHASTDERVQAAIAAGDLSCSACHTVGEHGYEPARHTSNETCLGSCHSLELGPTHDAVVPAVACEGCHPVAVEAVTPWDQTCTACHLVNHATANHTGTDAEVRISRSGNGCSDTSPENVNCHDISNVSALHIGLPGKGCALCHGEGKTPSSECRTCHPQDDPPTSEAFAATFYPVGDGPVVGTTVPSSGSTLWDLVDEPNPGDGDATYFQFTTPGSAMFTSPRSIPTSATITSVVVYARARTGSSTLRSYYPMVTVGGTNYQRSGTNVGSTYTGGAGVAYSLAKNPKTNAAWLPAELNSTGGASTLDSIGVGTSNASGTATGYLRVTQVNMVVNYTLPVEVPEGALLGTSWYHHNNVKYLWDAADAEPDAYYANNPPNGWNDALFYQDCYDFCHVGFGGSPPVFTAYEGEWMWYSTAGAYFPETRNLTLASITVPMDAPTLDFMTNWRMSGTDAGYVEISTDGGASYSPLTGTVGGVSRSSLTGNAEAWVPATYDLSAYAGQTLHIRFRFFVNDGAVGWAFDGLTINDSSGPVFSDDAETLKPDWTNYHWTRSMGAYPFF